MFGEVRERKKSGRKETKRLDEGHEKGKGMEEKVRVVDEGAKERKVFYCLLVLLATVLQITTILRTKTIAPMQLLPIRFVAISTNKQNVEFHVQTQLYCSTHQLQCYMLEMQATFSSAPNSIRNMEPAKPPFHPITQMPDWLKHVASKTTWKKKYVSVTLSLLEAVKPIHRIQYAIITHNTNNFTTRLTDTACHIITKRCK